MIERELRIRGNEFLKRKAYLKIGAALILGIAFTASATAQTTTDALPFEEVNETFTDTGMEFNFYNQTLNLTEKQVFAPDNISDHVTFTGYGVQDAPTGKRVQWNGITFEEGNHYGSSDANALLGNQAGNSGVDTSQAEDWTPYNGGAGYTTYNTGDIVLYDGSYYEAKGGTSNQLTPPENNGYWDQVEAGSGTSYPATFFNKGAFTSDLAQDNETISQVFRYDYQVEGSDYNVSIEVDAETHYEHLILEYDLVYSNSTDRVIVREWQDIYSGEDPEKLITGASFERNGSTATKRVNLPNLYEPETHELFYALVPENGSLTGINWDNVSHEKVNTSFETARTELRQANISENLILDSTEGYDLQVYNITLPADSNKTIELNYSYEPEKVSFENGNFQSLDPKEIYTYIVGSGSVIATDSYSSSGSYDYTIPEGTQEINITIKGAGGGRGGEGWEDPESEGGSGATASFSYYNEDLGGKTLNIGVGERGNDAVTYAGAGGGGSSAIRYDNGTILVCAGGGGGGGGGGGNDGGEYGGNGGKGGNGYGTDGEAGYTGVSNSPGADGGVGYYSGCGGGGDGGDYGANYEQGFPGGDGFMDFRIQDYTLYNSGVQPSEYYPGEVSIEAVQYNQAPVLENQTINIDRTTGQNDLSIGVEDGGELDIISQTGISNPNIFNNETLEKNGIALPFSSTVSVSDTKGAVSNDLGIGINTLAQGERSYSTHSHDTTVQQYEDVLELTSTGDGYSYQVKMPDKQASNVTSRTLTGSVAAGNSINDSVIYEGDWIKNEATEDGFSVNNTRPQSVSSQYLLEGTTFSGLNEKSYSFQDVNISNYCPEASLKNIPSGEFSVSCGATEVNGDFIEDTDQGKEVDQTVTLGNNFTVKNLVGLKETKGASYTDLNISSYENRPDSTCSLNSDLKASLGSNEEKNSSIDYTCESGSILNGTTTILENEPTSDFDTVQFEFYFEVKSNLSEESEIIAEINEDELPNWNDRQGGSTLGSVEGNTNDIVISDELEKVKFKIGDEHGNSSVHEGTHKATMEYYYGTGASNTGGGGGGGGGGGSQDEEPPENDGDFDMTFSSTEGLEAQYGTTSYPTFQVNNFGASSNKINIQKKEGVNACRYIQVESIVSVATNQDTGNVGTRHSGEFGDSGAYTIPPKDQSIFKSVYTEPVPVQVTLPEAEEMSGYQPGQSISCPFTVSAGEGTNVPDNMTITVTPEKSGTARIFDSIEGFLGKPVAGSSDVCLDPTSIYSEEETECGLSVGVPHPEMNLVSGSVWTGAFLVLFAGGVSYRRRFM